MAINHWPILERPREKLLANGPATLSDAELIAVLIHSGTRDQTAMDIARDLIANFDGLKPLLEADLDSLCQSPGIGPTKFSRLQAAIELGKRYLRSGLIGKDALTNPKQTKQYLMIKLKSYKHEVFACLFLDNKHQIIDFIELFHGTINGASVYCREVAKQALKHNAAAVIFAHNHPSGVAEPSQADIAITEKLKQSMELIDVRVLDHIVVGDNHCQSMAEMGLI